MRLEILDFRSSRLGGVDELEDVLDARSAWRLESIDVSASLSADSSVEEIVPADTSDWSSCWSRCKGEYCWAPNDADEMEVMLLSCLAERT